MIQSNREAREQLGAERFLELYEERFFDAMYNEDIEEMEKQLELYKAIVGEDDLMFYLLVDLYENYTNID
jgi:hypothetical protein